TRVSALQRLVDCSRNLCFFPFHVHPTGSAHWLGLKQRQRYRGTHRHSPRLYGSRLERTCTSRRGRDSSTTRGQLPSPPATSSSRSAGLRWIAERPSK